MDVGEQIRLPKVKEPFKGSFWGYVEGLQGYIVSTVQRNGCYGFRAWDFGVSG